MKPIYSITLYLTFISLLAVSSYAKDDGDRKTKRRSKKTNATSSTGMNGNYKHQYAQNTNSSQTKSISKIEPEVIDQNYKHQGTFVVKNKKSTPDNTTSNKKVVQKKNNMSYKHQFGL